MDDPRQLIDKDIFEHTGNPDRQILLQIVRELKKVQALLNPKKEVKK